MRLANWRAARSKLSAEDMEYMLYKVTQEMYEPYSGLKYCLPTLNYTEDQQSRIADLTYEFENYYNEVIYGFITGEMDVDNDSDWQAHLDNLENYGVSEICEIYQSAYDAMYK